ncbi:MAG: 50S ribosomal protein L18 [Proteobacteria bacterium]|nr:50S ribosomal protein L18 [Pseudomonadota bacterium]
MATKRIEKIRIKRKKRVRGKVSGTEKRPRLSVFRSAAHIYVQAVADDSGRTLAEASTLSKEPENSLGDLKNMEAAKAVGMLLAKRLQAIGIEEAVFDRGRYLYHGRVKSLADGAREAGLKF